MTPTLAPHEALRLADLLLDLQTHLGPRRDEKDPDEQSAWDGYTDAAAELRRLHAENESLRAQAADRAVPAGVVLVPKLMTNAMFEAFKRPNGKAGDWSLVERYAAMLAAAPGPVQKSAANEHDHAGASNNQQESNMAAPAQLGYEHERAIMEGERDNSLEKHAKGMSWRMNSPEIRAYEAGFSNGWDRCAARTAQAAAPQPPAPIRACPGVPDPRCDYLAACGAACNKCGHVHQPERFNTPAPAATADAQVITMVDAAMVEMKNITPPLRRSECQRLILAALAALRSAA